MFSKSRAAGQESIILFILSLGRKAWTNLRFKLFPSVCVGLFSKAFARNNVIAYLRPQKIQ